MQRAKTFFLVCAGMFLLALAYHLGASTATAQAPGNSVVSVTAYGGYAVALTANGDCYVNNGIEYPTTPWTYRGNMFGAGPIPTEQGTWGQLKVRYRGEQAPAGR